MPMLMMFDLSDLREDSKLVAFQSRQKSIVPSHHINLHWSRNPPPPPPSYPDMGTRRQLHWGVHCSSAMVVVTVTGRVNTTYPTSRMCDGVPQSLWKG
ncbi:hypothetical protein BO85DRAFT_448330 [Aspergillus piperis CBS 112811]|uniref:Uncharacterized protein n=1 Tax=Aspergillus piperis CBS 112811 TaxID=1448313 RepID=A0A8G1R7P4_9EURO|nr:hypothetical protein BO85DRAFT_448330 [Aspergillus piperis CBS 112811]RAH58270.1 hypothetical protein BO85DRAFT_448330 [Aspergillus piperis CBS 112811]